MREVFKRLISLALIFLIVFMPYTNVIDVEMFKVSASATCGPNDYVMAEDGDFNGDRNGQFRYIGSDECVEIPHNIKGVNVTSYFMMFSDSSGAESSTIKGIKSTNENVTDMRYMFSDSQATSLDLSSFDTSNVTNMLGMFQGASIDELDATGWDTSKVENMKNMFSWGRNATGGLSQYSVKSVKGIKDWNLQSVTNIDDMFKYTRMDDIWDIYETWGSKGYFDNLESFQGMFSTANQNSFPEAMDLSKIFGSEFDYSKIENMSGMFDHNKASSIIFPENFNTSNVTNMSRMFESSSALELDLSSFNTSNVTNMNYMFERSSATELDLSSFNTSNVTNMNSMFNGSQATTLDLSSFDTSNVTNMSYMFYNSRVTSLDLSSFDTSNVTNMTWMFRNTQATKGYARTQADADKLNGSSLKPSELNFVLKKGTPVISFSENGNSTYKKSQTTKVSVDWSKGEKEILEYQWTNSSSFPSGGTWISFSSGNTITKQNGTGDFYLHIRAKSKQGITEEITSNVFRLDNESPGITNLNNNYLFNYRVKNKEISFSISDEHSGLNKIEYQLKNSNNQNVSIENQNKNFNNTKNEDIKLMLPSDLDEGQYTLNVKVYDDAGNSFNKDVNIIIEGTLELEISGDVSNNQIDFGNLTLNGQDTQESDSRQINYKITDTRQNPGWTLQMSYSGFGGGDPGTKLLVRDRAGGQSLEVENQLITIDSGSSAEKTIKKNLSIQIPKTTKAGSYSMTIQITLVEGLPNP